MCELVDSKPAPKSNSGSKVNSEANIAAIAASGMGPNPATEHVSPQQKAQVGSNGDPVLSANNATVTKVPLLLRGPLIGWVSPV